MNLDSTEFFVTYGEVMKIINEYVKDDGKEDHQDWDREAERKAKTPIERGELLEKIKALEGRRREKKPERKRKEPFIEVLELSPPPNLSDSEIRRFGPYHQQRA